MGVNNALSFCLDALKNRPQAVERAKRFHDQHNHRIVRHMLSHFCLGGLATLDRLQPHGEEVTGISSPPQLPWHFRGAYSYTIQA